MPVMAESESALIDLHFNKSYHFPLTDIPPLSVQLLATELNDVDNWYQLGAVLGVPPKRLDEIRKSSPVGGTGEWKIAMLQDWMDSKPDASWVDVIVAVKSLRHLALAAILKSKYVPKTTEPSHDAGILYACVQSDFCALITLFAVCVSCLCYTVLLFSSNKSVRGTCQCGCCGLCVARAKVLLTDADKHEAAVY